jgi:hypothetical protein
LEFSVFPQGCILSEAEKKKYFLKLFPTSDGELFLDTRHLHLEQLLGHVILQLLLCR